MSQVPLAPPPSTGGPLDSWLYLLWRRMTQAGQILWATITPGTSADVAAVVTDETGSPGSLVFSANPTLTGLTVSDAAFTSRGITDNATTTALTLSGSGANSVTIANSAGNPTIRTTAGALKLGTVSKDGIVVNPDSTADTYIEFVMPPTTNNYTSFVSRGTGTNVGMFFSGKGNGAVGLFTNSLGNLQAAISHTPNADRYLLFTGGTASPALNPTISTSAGDINFPQNIVLPKTSGKGIQVDTASPSFGWRDIIGQIGIKTAGATDPVWTLYRGSMYAYTFNTATAEAFMVFHIPHDYVPGTDLFIHVHWSQNVVDTGGAAGVPGVAEWKFDITYADGHGTAGGAADPFVAPITVTVTQQASTTQYGHMIAEVQFTNSGGTGGLIDSATIQVDGLLLVRLYRVKANPADTLNQAPFVHTADIHYQSSNIGTKQKAPNFYV